MNTIWSDHIQGVNTLYLSRRLRFHDRFSGLYLPQFGLDPDGSHRILEIGCGPGALAQALHRWYPNASITALDRDSRFIAFAKAHIPDITFLEGDAASLPFPDNCFDVVISHTLAEHMDPQVFYSEQHRVLAPQGVCLVLTSRKTIQRTAPCLEPNEFETRFWERAAEQDDSFERFGVGKHWLGEDKLPAVMGSFGFRQLSTGYISIPLTPDSADTPPELAMAIITASRDAELENLNAVMVQLQGFFPQNDYLSMSRLINARYQQRLDQYQRGEKQWDTEVASIMILRGIKA